jgi:hypothetical protein
MINLQRLNLLMILSMIKNYLKKLQLHNNKWKEKESKKNSKIKKRNNSQRKLIKLNYKVKAKHKWDIF